MKKELVWNVYRYDINSKKIEIYNIFDHWVFYDYLYKAKRKYLTKKNFDFKAFIEQVKRELSYYFFSKVECEISISEPFPDQNSIYKKIDIYEQVMLNWEVFKEYLFNNYKYIRKRED